MLQPSSFAVLSTLSCWVCNSQSQLHTFGGGGRRGGPRPWPQRLFAFSRPSHLSGAAALPGVELFLKNPTFFEQATCPGQLRCLGQNFFSEIRLFEQATCPGQLRCLGQNFFLRNPICLKKPLVPGSFAAWGRTFSQKSDLF